MTIKQKLVMLVAAFCLLTGVPAFLYTGSVLAQANDTTDTTSDGTPAESENKPACDPTEDEDCCNGVKTSIIKGDICQTNGDGSSADNSIIWNLLLALLKIMTAGIGIAAVGGIVYGALLYTTAENKPDQTKKAIGIITNVVIGLVAYAMMFVLLNWLIPGGIFK